MSEDPYSVPTGYVPRGPYATRQATREEKIASPGVYEVPKAYRLVDPQGRVRCDESTAVKAWARLGGYKSTVESLLAWEEEGWTVIEVSQ